MEKTLFFLIVQTPVFSTHFGESTFSLSGSLPNLFTEQKVLWFLALDLGFDLQHLQRSDLLFCLIALNPYLALFSPSQFPTNHSELRPASLPLSGARPWLPRAGARLCS